MRRFLFLLPIVLLSMLAGLAVIHGMLAARDTPQLMAADPLGRPAPDFDMPPLFAGRPGLETADLKGKVTLVNFFASWCGPCQIEHSFLAGLKGQGLVLAGVDYKNRPEEARAWLAVKGNPYDTIAADPHGHVAFAFGVYGIPASYLIDKQGIIRFAHFGPLTPDVILTRLLPLARELEK